MFLKANGFFPAPALGAARDLMPSIWPRRRKTMIPSLARHASSGAAAALKHALGWPARIAAARRTMTQLPRMTDAELRDFGLVRQDIVDVGALRFASAPTAALARRRSGAERP